MRIAAPLLFAPAVLLAACVSNPPVSGVVQGAASGGKERFTGVATGSLRAGGTIEIRSERTTCTGSFQSVSAHRGSGTFVCADGRRGPFEFTATDDKRGVGKFLTEPFIFTFS